jgi:probable HAF family extracellular repeat protein
MNGNSFSGHQLGRWAFAMFCTLAAAAYAAPANKYVVQELGKLAGIGGSPRAITNFGVIAGGSYVADAPNPVTHAVVWGYGYTYDLGATLGRDSQVYAMNEKGSIAGLVDQVPFLWKFGRTTRLPFSGNINAMNRDEAIVGNFWTSGVFGVGGNRAYVFQDGVLRDLGTIGGGPYYYSSANDINDSGVVVGFSQLPFSSDMRAVLWENGVIRDLGGLGGHNSSAGRINNQGVIVGTAETADGKVMMVSWNVQGAMQVLGESLSPMALNERGAIAGNNLKTGKAFLLEDGVLTNLSDLPEMRAAGWVSFAPFVLNDRGWIAGLAWKPGISPLGTAVLLVPSNSGSDFGKN